MGIFNKLLGGVGAKASAAGSAIAAFTVGQPVWTPRQYAKLADEGYVKNVIAYRCISMIASGAASVPWLLTAKRGNGNAIETHPLLKLLQRPNPMQGGAEFFEQLVSFYLLSGNSYLEGVRPSDSKPPLEIYALRPDRIKVIPSAFGTPSAYVYEVNGSKKRWEIDPLTGKGDILHFKRFHPLNDWYGMSPLEAAAYSIDQHNLAGEHNAALLQNGARPSGALAYGEQLTKEQQESVLQLLLDRFQSPKNAGRPMVLGGKDLKWLEMALTPRDMDFTNATLQTARNVCSAFAVPHLLVVPGESTYNNRQDARLELWEDTIIPLLDRLTDALNNWLVPMYGDGYTLSYDLDNVTALAPRRQSRYSNAIQAWNAGLIQKNEAREEIGFDTVADGEEFKPGGFGIDQTLSRRPGAVKTTKVTYISDELDDPLVYAKVSALLDAMLDDMVHRFGKDAIEEIGKQNAFANSARVQDFIHRHSAQLITQINKTTKRQIQDTLAEGFSAGEGLDAMHNRVMDVFADASESRAATIALTESTHAAGFGTNEAIIQSGVEYKEWLAVQDQHTRETHSQLDGQSVPSEGVFQSSSGDTAPYPGAFGLPEENINCRCAVVAKFGNKSIKTMSAEERKAMWEAKEAKRKSVEDAALPLIRRAFALQQEAVLARLKIALG